MKTLKSILSTAFLLSLCVLFTACPSDIESESEPDSINDQEPIIGTWHGWMDNYQKNPEEGHIWKWGEFGCLTVKSDYTAELEWWDGDRFESHATMTYSWKKTADGYLLTYKSVRMTDPNKDDDFDDFACDMQIKLVNSTTIDLGMWVGESDETHEQLTKGSFDLEQYRDLAKRDFYGTTWHGTLGSYSCEVNLGSISSWDLYQEGRQYPSYYFSLNYKKEGDVFKFSRRDNSGDAPSGFDKLEMQYVNSSQIKFRQQGSSTWSIFTPGKYTPTQDSGTD